MESSILRKKPGTKRFGLHSNSRGADEIKDLWISIDFRNRNTELLLTFIIISSCFSEAGTLNCKVPQGSILGPLLFFAIHDIPLALSNTRTFLYADVTSIFCQHKDVTELRKSKMFWIKNLRVYAIRLLITRYQFILVKIKQNAFFSVGIRTYLSLT